MASINTSNAVSKVAFDRNAVERITKWTRTWCRVSSYTLLGLTWYLNVLWNLLDSTFRVPPFQKHHPPEWILSKHQFQGEWTCWCPWDTRLPSQAAGSARIHNEPGRHRASCQCRCFPDRWPAELSSVSRLTGVLNRCLWGWMIIREKIKVPSDCVVVRALAMSLQN